MKTLFISLVLALASAYPPQTYITTDMASDIYVQLFDSPGTYVNLDHSDPDSVFETTGSTFGFGQGNSNDWRGVASWRWTAGSAFSPGEDLQNYAIRVDDGIVHFVFDRLEGQRGNSFSVWVCGKEISLSLDTDATEDDPRGTFFPGNINGDYMVDISVSYAPNRFGDDGYIRTWKWINGSPYIDIAADHFITMNKENVTVEEGWFDGPGRTYGPFELFYGWIDLETIPGPSDWELHTVIINSRLSRNSVTQKRNLLSSLGDFVLRRF